MAASEERGARSEGRVIRQIAGRATPVRGNDIDTDRIIPARFLKSVTFDGLERHLFEDDRKEAAAAGATHVVDEPRYEGASILLVNANFGCGSSREHAPQAIYRSGIRAIVGESFSEIFFGNSVALGMPCVAAPAETVEALMALVESSPSAMLTVDLQAMTVTTGDRTVAVSLPPGARESFLDGSWDATGLLLEHFDQVRAVAARLPYINAFH